MEVKVGEQPNLKIQLSPARPINVHMESKFILGGAFVASNDVSAIVVLSKEDYENLEKTENIDNKTLYLTYD